MIVWKNTLFAGVLALTLVALPALAQHSKSGTTLLTLGVVAESSLTVNDGTTPLKQTDAATLFADWTGSTSLTYKVRTSRDKGTGLITVKLAEFDGKGPKVALDLRYSSVSTMGTTVTTATPDTVNATPVLTFGENARSAKTGNGATVNWTLTNNPAFETGSYESLATFTISAL